MAPVACFDVFGTCFSLDGLADLFKRYFAEELRKDRSNGQTLALSWFYQTQRDFTYLSMTSRYTPIAKVFAATLTRAILQHLPSSYSGRTPPSPHKLDAIKSGLSSLPARPGLAECARKLRDAGFECWAVTNGGSEATKGYFSQGKVQSSEGHWFAGRSAMEDRIVSCDEIELAKPDPRVYEHCRERVSFGNGPNVFIAAHTWDLGPAKDAGFTTAWVAHEELLPIDELWGKPDIEAENLSTLADRIIAHLERH